MAWGRDRADTHLQKHSKESPIMQSAFLDADIHRKHITPSLTSQHPAGVPHNLRSPGPQVIFNVAIVVATVSLICDKLSHIHVLQLLCTPPQNVYRSIVTLRNVALVVGHEDTVVILFHDSVELMSQLHNV